MGLAVPGYWLDLILKVLSHLSDWVNGALPSQAVSVNVSEVRLLQRVLSTGTSGLPSETKKPSSQGDTGASGFRQLSK